jgi:2-polyprenyl-3-methyl-5-hydroxy-6-metoxy-1,4-benzoquinol methylase
MTKNNLKATLFHQSAHLLEHDLLTPSAFCTFCESTQRTPVANLQESPDVVLLHCQKCHASSASRMPKPETLSKYYSRYYDSFDDKDEKITLDAPDRMACHIVQHAKSALGKLTGREISILDYGGGDGSISAKIAHELIMLGAAKVSIALIDYNTSTIEPSDNRIKIYRPNDLKEISDKTMHLVVASAVLEHIPEPREILARLLASLKPDGIFYARTPYVTPLSKIAKAVNIKFDFTYPAHVHDLGAKFWNNVIHILPLEGQFSVFRSTPSIVETTFEQHFLRTLIAHTLKLPGYIFKEAYGLVGGWEVFIRRMS